MNAQEQMAADAAKQAAKPAPKDASRQAQIVTPRLGRAK